ncbi:uncharacterized protein LOC113758909 isoform X1 [Coffea eugenioides]|uniref:uncharacterized protein LOC113758909 isoform X1 n=1 Tax=Coffea eugenioides TaxID=49369 RepID=UPI000F60FF4B|nr:uncharacterized protein LOC113758909 isoform X1 [Coffea eugenioides]
MGFAQALSACAPLPPPPPPLHQKSSSVPTWHFSSFTASPRHSQFNNLYQEHEELGFKKQKKKKKKKENHNSILESHRPVQELLQRIPNIKEKKYEMEKFATNPSPSISSPILVLEEVATRAERRESASQQERTRRDWMWDGLSQKKKKKKIAVVLLSARG